MVELVDTLNVREHLRDHVVREHVVGAVLYHYLEVEHLERKKVL